MAQNGKKILVYFLLIVIFLGTWKFLVLNEELRVAKKQIAGDKLLLGKIAAELEESRSQLAIVTEKLGSLEKDNSELRMAKKALEEKVADLQSQKQEIELKIRSLSGLRALIRQMKMDQELARKKLLGQIDAKKLQLGNRGLIVKEGRPNNKSLANIEVTVLSAESGSL